jgi:hypothetical protein
VFRGCYIRCYIAFIVVVCEGVATHSPTAIKQGPEMNKNVFSRIGKYVA